jgi:hypothetical protein
MFKFEKVEVSNEAIALGGGNSAQTWPHHQGSEPERTALPPQFSTHPPTADCLLLTDH